MTERCTGFGVNFTNHLCSKVREGSVGHNSALTVWLKLMKGKDQDAVRRNVFQSENKRCVNISAYTPAAWWQCSEKLEVPWREAGPWQGWPLATSYLQILLRAPDSLALLSYVLVLQLAERTDHPPWPFCYFPVPGGTTSEGEAVRWSRGPCPAEPLRPAAGSPPRPPHSSL